jgi:twitching motility protein PilT
MIFEDWIEQAWSLGASDLHLEAGTPPVVRVRGDLQILGGAVPGEVLVQTAQDLLGAEDWAEFRKQGSADLSTAISGVRCRINFFRTVRGIAVAIRLLESSIKDIHGCNLHPDFRKFTEATTGLVIISGPTGSGKSTTLAALVEEINGSRARNVITLESPLEYIYTNRRSFIRQREIPAHSPSFEQGIVDALRENPDVLVVSEMRTPEVMRLTLNAAETGHLVLATMHSANCAEALTRLCMSFPSDIQGSIRAQLADCLVGICCQRLDYLSAHRLSECASAEGAALRNTASEFGGQRNDSGGEFQPDHQRTAVRRRGGHVDLRSIPTLDGAGEGLGTAHGPAKRCEHGGGGEAGTQAYARQTQPWHARAEQAPAGRFGTHRRCVRSPGRGHGSGATRRACKESGGEETLVLGCRGRLLSNMGSSRA